MQVKQEKFIMMLEKKKIFMDLQQKEREQLIEEGIELMSIPLGR